MIDLKRTSSNLDDEHGLGSSVSFTEEGQVVIASSSLDSDGKETVARCDSDTSAYVLGFAKLDDAAGPQTEDIQSGTGKVPATADTDSKYLVDIGHLLITSDYDTNGDVRVYDSTDATWLTLGGTVADGTFIVDDAANGKLGFHSAQKGNKIKFWARVTMTATERDMKYQQRHVNRKGQAALTRVGTVTGTGRIFTDQYDTTISDTAWETGPLQLGPDGIVTAGGSGADLSSCMRLIKTPSVTDPTLGLAFQLPANV